MYAIKKPKILFKTLTEKHKNGSVATWHISDYRPPKRLGNEGLHPLLYWAPKTK